MATMMIMITRIGRLLCRLKLVCSYELWLNVISTRNPVPNAENVKMRSLMMMLLIKGLFRPIFHPVIVCFAGWVVSLPSLF